MPCDSSYMEPSSLERQSRAIMGFFKELGLTLTGKQYDSYYGNTGAIDDDVERLCTFLGGRTREWIRDNTSLELQVFWRDHQKADAERLANEKARAETARLKAAALAKLTPAERKALGR